VKNVVAWDVTPCGSCENQHFGELVPFIIRVKRISELEATLTLFRSIVSFLVQLVFLRSVLQLLGTANGVSCSLILFSLMMEAIRFSEMSVFARAARRHTTEDDILQKLCVLNFIFLTMMAGEGSFIIIQNQCKVTTVCICVLCVR
jgi:hypothetical protein